MNVDNIADVDVNEGLQDKTSTSKSEDGNTKSSSSQRVQKKKKEQPNQLKNWFFTWNNYPQNWKEILEPVFTRICTKFVMQPEVGKQGTPHIQGSISLKKKMRWSEFGLPNTINWGKTRNEEAADAYCSKEESRAGPTIEWNDKMGYVKAAKPLKIIENLKPWQQTLTTMCSEDADDRQINWLYDPSGCMGKTVLCKYLFIKNNAIIVTGGASRDIACLLAGLVKEGRDLNDNTTIIFNLPRSKTKVSYEGLEAVKDGLITSPKYESSTLVFNSPHLWIFANTLPQFEKISADKWVIWEIVNDQLHQVGNKQEIPESEKAEGESDTDYTDLLSMI